MWYSSRKNFQKCHRCDIINTDIWWHHQWRTSQYIPLFLLTACFQNLLFFLCLDCFWWAGSLHDQHLLQNVSTFSFSVLWTYKEHMAMLFWLHLKCLCTSHKCTFWCSWCDIYIFCTCTIFHLSYSTFYWIVGYYMRVYMTVMNKTLTYMRMSCAVKWCCFKYNSNITISWLSVVRKWWKHFIIDSETASIWKHMWHVSQG